MQTFVQEKAFESASGKRLKDCSGLSLVQLLVAISILAVLAAILLPALVNTREAALASGCRGHLRQLAAAGILFANDNGGILPDRTAWANAEDDPKSLAPYLGLPSRTNGESIHVDTTMTCPSIQSSEYQAYWEFNRTYSINSYATGSDTGSSGSASWPGHVQGRDAPLTLQGVREPTKQAFFMDGTGQPHNDHWRYSVFTAPDRLNPDAEWSTVYIHNGSIHVAFIDGHVERITLEEAKDNYIGPTNPTGGVYSPRVLPFWGAGR